MREARLKLFTKINAIDAVLDNTLLPIVTVLCLIAYLWDMFR